MKTKMMLSSPQSLTLVMKIVLILSMMSTILEAQPVTSPPASLSSSSPSPSQLNTTQRLTLANNYFAFKLLQKFGSNNTNSNENIFYSPFSIVNALTMVYSGARAQTATQLERALGFHYAELVANTTTTTAPTTDTTTDTGIDAIDGTKKALIFDAIRKTMQKIQPTKTTPPSTNGDEANSSYTLRLGNAILTNVEAQIDPKYLDTIKQEFSAQHFVANFRNEGEQVKRLVNEWCATVTNGKIPAILRDAPDPATQLALMNAIYFAGKWKNAFNSNRTESGKFTAANGAIFNDVQYMFELGKHFRYTFVSELNAKMIELEYENDTLSLYALIPEDVTTLSQIRASLNPWLVESAIQRMRSTEVAVLKFPRLKFNTEYDLIPALRAFGVQDAFNGGKANFSDISSVGNLAIGEVKHAAGIEVNEQGTEAAAATYVGIMLMSAVHSDQPPVRVECDRSFIFFIRHKITQQILFIGEVHKF